MADIKVKEKSNIKIKKLDKSKIYSEKLKKNIVGSKDNLKDNNENDDNTPSQYASNQIADKSKILMSKGVIKFNEYGKKSVQETKNNIQMTTQQIKRKMQINNFKKKEEKIKAIKESYNSIKSSEIVNKKGVSNIVKTRKQDKIKLTEDMKSINTSSSKILRKNVPKTTQNVIKESQKITRDKAKVIKKAYQITKTTAKKTAETIKIAVKKSVSAVRAIIAGTKALISAIMAGGWIAMVLIVIICFIALICSSALGIFFSNEKSVNTRTMSSVMTEINTEFASKLAEIQNATEHDDFEIHSNRAKWKDVLAVYAVLVTGGNDQSDVIILDDKKIQRLKGVFWDMNLITSKVEVVEKDIEIINDDGSVTVEKQARKVLYIDIASKTVEEMIQQYHFNKNQLQQLAELQKEKYSFLWNNVLYGSSAGSSDIVQVALSQIGNVGGEPFWSWYGFNARVEWCACFVSWCANECGYIESGLIPKFAACHSEGIAWFQTCGLWQERGFIPNSRRYNIF